VASSIKVVDLFAAIGMKVDVRQLNVFQKRLALVKKQLLDLKRLARARLSPNTNIGAVRSLNTELARTLRLARQIQTTGGINVRRTGGGARGGGRRGGGGAGQRGFFGGAAAGSLGLRGGLGRNFLGGFTAIVAVKELFQATAAMQGIEVALGAITREGQTTAEIMGFLRGEAQRLGFDFRTSALEYAKLAAAGNSVNLELETVNQIFIAAQEASRVFNLSVADTEGVLKAFTQIISKGKITAEELRNQLGDRLPGAVGIFAKALGKTTQELSEMLEKGQVLADDETLQAVAKELRRTVETQVAAASRSLTAVLNRTKTALFEFGAALGKSGISKIFIDALKIITSLFKLLGPPLILIITTINILLIPFRALGSLLGTMIDRMPAAVAAFAALNIVLFATKVALFQVAAAWLVAFAPIIASFVMISALVLVIEDWFVAVDGGDSIIGRMARSTNFWNAMLGGMLVNLGKLVQFMGELAAAVITGDFTQWSDSLKEFIATIKEFLRVATGSALLTDFFESLDIGGKFEAAKISPTSEDVRSSQSTLNSNVTVEITGDTEVIKEAVVKVNEGERIQAQAEQGDNE